MKKLIFISLAVFAYGTVTKASTADLFKIDEVVVAQQLADISQIEQIVDNHAGITLNSLKDMLADNALSDIDMSVSDVGGILSTLEPPLGVPSFLWGCVLGWVGILIVYLVSDDREETKKALYGCLVGAGAYIIFYVIYVALIVSSAAI